MVEKQTAPGREATRRGMLERELARARRQAHGIGRSISNTDELGGDFETSRPLPNAAAEELVAETLDDQRNVIG